MTAIATTGAVLLISAMVLAFSLMVILLILLTRYTLIFAFFIIKLYFKVTVSFFIFFYRIIIFPETQPENSESLSHRISGFLLKTYYLPVFGRFLEQEEIMEFISTEYNSRLSLDQKEFIKFAIKKLRKRLSYYCNIILKKVVLLAFLCLPYIAIISINYYYYAPKEHKKQNIENSIKIFQNSLSKVGKKINEQIKDIKPKAADTYKAVQKLFNTEFGTKTPDRALNILAESVRFVSNFTIIVAALLINQLTLLFMLMFISYFILYYILLFCNSSMVGYTKYLERELEKREQKDNLSYY